MKTTCILITVLFMCSVVHAQKPAEETESASYANRLKLNLTAIPLNNYMLQYERVLTRKSAVAISFRLMPESKLPFQSQIKRLVADEDVSIQKTVDQLRMSNYAITPEYRFYFGKGTAKGFYIAPFYRYASFEATNAFITYQADLPGTEESINLSGDLKSHTGGLLFGAHWNLSKRICLDWMIVGPHFGSGNGNFKGLSSRPLSQSEQQRVRDELEELDIPLTNKTVTVNGQGATLKLDGPWGGLRSGVSLGINF